MLSFDFQKNFFQLFGLPERFQLDRAELGQRYRTLQSEVHPDKFADRTEAEQRISMQWATQLNEAYKVLGDPVGRGRYLLKLQGVDTLEETNTAMPTDFLMQQMEWREAVVEAVQSTDYDGLTGMETRVQQEMRELEQGLADKIDEKREYESAALDVRKLKFMQKLAEEIASAFDEVDGR